MINTCGLPSQTVSYESKVALYTQTSVLVNNVKYTPFSSVWLIC